MEDIDVEISAKKGLLRHLWQWSKNFGFGSALSHNTVTYYSHVQSIAHKASGLSHSLLKATVCRSKEFMIFLLVTHIRPVLEYSSCLWYTGYVNDMRLLEKVQRRWTKQIEGLSALSYADRLKFLNLYSVQGRLLRADLLQYWKILNGRSSIVPTDIFQLSPETRTRGHRLKLFCPTVRTDVRKRFFSVRCLNVWNSLPASAVCAPDLSQLVNIKLKYATFFKHKFCW